MKIERFREKKSMRIICQFYNFYFSDTRQDAELIKLGLFRPDGNIHIYEGEYVGKVSFSSPKKDIILCLNLSTFYPEKETILKNYFRKLLFRCNVFQGDTGLIEGWGGDWKKIPFDLLMKDAHKNLTNPNHYIRDICRHLLDAQ